MKEFLSDLGTYGIAAIVVLFTIGFVGGYVFSTMALGG